MSISFTSDKTTLLSLFSPAAYASSGKSTLPALEGLLIKLTADTLSVIGYDLEKGIRTMGSVVGRGDGAVIINTAKLLGIIRNLPDCDITFDGDDKNMVVIKGGESEFSIHGIDPSAFPSLPELSGENRLSVKSSLLRELILTTSHAVAVVDARPILMGELFSVKGKDLTVVTTDNFRLAKRDIKNCVEGEKEEYNFVVPGKSLLELVKLIPDNDSLIRIEFTRRYVIFNFGDVTLFSRLLDGEFMNYNKVIPTEGKTFVTVDRNALIESIERASLIVDEKLRTAIKFDFEDGMLNISCATHYGKVNDNLKISMTGENIVIGFNNKYLLDALKACKDEKINITLFSPLMSVIITPVEKKEESDYLYLVLPMRIKD